MLDLNDLIAPGSGWTLSTKDMRSTTPDRSPVLAPSAVKTHAFLLTPVTVAEVPEPGTLALMGAGIIGLGLLRRRKGRNDVGTQARRDPTLNRLRSMTLISRGHR